MSFIYFIYLSISSNKLVNDQQVIRLLHTYACHPLPNQLQVRFLIITKVFISGINTWYYYC